MIHHLRGQVIEKTLTHLVIECNGVGYFVKVSVNASEHFKIAESAFVFTEMIVREDAQLLYGFHDITERETFNQLISVSGIGPNTAIVMLSSMTPDQIVSAISLGDVPAIQSIKGIGAKTAQRVIVDLKDKVGKIDIQQGLNLGQGNTIKIEALSALVSLGFDKKKSTKVLDSIVKSGDEKIENVIKEALKIL